MEKLTAHCGQQKGRLATCRACCARAWFLLTARARHTSSICRATIRGGSTRWPKADKLETVKHDGASKSVFDRAQMLYGLTYSPCSLLWDVELRRHVEPIEVITFDAMHATVANGIVQNETGWLLSSLRHVGITWGWSAIFALWSIGDFAVHSDRDRAWLHASPLPARKLGRVGAHSNQKLRRCF